MQLHSPARSRNSRGERSGDLIELETDRHRSGSRGDRVRHLVPPGQPKLYLRFRLTVSTVMERKGVPPISVTY